MTSPYIITGGECSTNLQYVTIIILVIILVLIVKVVFPGIYASAEDWWAEVVNGGYTAVSSAVSPP